MQYPEYTQTVSECYIAVRFGLLCSSFLHRYHTMRDVLQEAHAFLAVVHCKKS